MDNNTASIIVVIFFTLSTVSFLLLIVGLFKPSLVVRRPSLQTRKGVFLIWGLIAVFSTGGGFFIAGVAEDVPDSIITEPVQPRDYYVGVSGANIRECQATSCKVIDTIPANTKLTFSGDLFDKYPDWAEVTFPDGRVGYVSKTVLSENAVAASEPPPSGGPSSTGGITIGPWANIQTTVGQSYEFHFCEPPAAISGATCGGLAGATTDPRGGTPPYSFVKKSGFLPPGIALELNGTLRGTPTETGTYNFRLCAKDLYGGEGCQNLAVVVGKTETSANTPPPVTEYAEFAKIESTTCQALGYSMPDNPNSWIVFRVTVTGIGGGGDLTFSCDHRYGGGPCHQQSLTCDSWTVKHVGSCVRETGQPAVTRWIYTAEGAMSLDIGFNFAVNPTWDADDAVRINIPCGD